MNIVTLHWSSKEFGNKKIMEISNDFMWLEEEFKIIDVDKDVNI